MNLKPIDIRKKLDETVIGQDNAKKSLSISLYDHMKAIRYPELQNSTTLLIGETGTGKTLMMSSLAKIANLPFISVDSTSISNYGYKGTELEDVIIKLCISAEHLLKQKTENPSIDEIIKLTEHGIVFFDEIDKLFGNKMISTGGNSPTLELQYEFLRLFEGKDLILKYNNKDISINTSKILFVLGGSFSKIFSEKSNENLKKIGFFLNKHEENENNYPNISQNKDNAKIKNINFEDLKKFGIVNEIIGRISTLVIFDSLDEDILYRILIEPKNSIIEQYEIAFKLDNIKIKFEKSALKEIARLAYSKKIGARGLKSTLETFIKDIKFYSPSCKNLSKIIITEESIHDYRKAIFMNFERKKIDFNSIAKSVS